MSREYKPQVIEKTIQEDWIKNNKFKAIPDEREKFYCLSMFPYPSGKLSLIHI